MTAAVKRITAPMAARARARGAVPDELPGRCLAAGGTLSAAWAAANAAERCRSGSRTPEIDTASSLLAQFTAMALSPVGRLSIRMSDPGESLASGPTMPQMTIHHSRGSPSALTLTATVAPMSSRTADDSASPACRAALMSACGIGAVGAARTGVAARAWMSARSATTAAILLSSRRRRRFAPRTTCPAS
ncbi:MAG TPA: hypothetical protein VFQ44_07660 [Streptosporangiaceae bacterium]|nr:hypothetical protein [Streptosporangiaceae bacterium]